VPYYWTLYGIAIDRHYYTQRPPATWGLIFDTALIPPYLCVFEDIRPLSLIAAQYLFGTLKDFNVHEINEIKKILKIQKKHVEIYTDNRSEYVLASGATPVVAGLSGDFLKVMRRFDNFEFLVPQEGAFAIIDSFAIPTASNKDDLIYQFLNYLFKKEIVQLYVDKFEFFPAVRVPVEYDERFAEFIEPTNELFKNVHFFKNVLSSDVLNDILIALKS
jgi:spermidine/putrescine-binding protein